jgi:hypothetical protein
VVSNTRAAVAAYAEAVTDGVEDKLRHRLFDAIWTQRRNLSGAYDVRRVITEVRDSASHRHLAIFTLTQA